MMVVGRSFVCVKYHEWMDNSRWYNVRTTKLIPQFRVIFRNVHAKVSNDAGEAPTLVVIVVHNCT